MNKFIQAIRNLDHPAVEVLLEKDDKWLNYAEDGSKNALHYLGGVAVSDEAKADTSLQILKLLLSKGMDMNSVHQIKDGGCFFPATPLWYAYTRGRNKLLYAYLLSAGANPQNCMFAIAWYNDVEAAALFKQHGADIEALAGEDTPFLGAFHWRRFEVAEWFLQNGANVNHPRGDGNTALFYAVKRKYKPEQVQLLLRYGADPDHENHAGISPRKLAEANRQMKLLGMFNAK
ncbi:ankyrin repeat domain-containing protein [Mucilaginibacter mali]|uniref:Ankyrin repeat domain-containing protein n=1 Tax=Mucilaginibacter mali TaxID=2740462 RepID=A0A7D4QFV8_9SPHI|nr:ankyrin repeat domain-containing protein [Mucilaginibacter mali]QKJ32784.1 ankyrin repeat domain-containing protein [Mucilaginibacter mali]